MQIQYLKDSPQGKVGEIATVTEIEARVLIALGHAVAMTDECTVDENIPKKRTKKQS